MDISNASINLSDDQKKVLNQLFKWYQKDHSLTPSLSYEEAARKVDKLLEIANITSSDTDSAVIEAAIGRRL